MREFCKDKSIKKITTPQSSTCKKVTKANSQIYHNINIQGVGQNQGNKENNWESMVNKHTKVKFSTFSDKKNDIIEAILAGLQALKIMTNNGVLL